MTCKHEYQIINSSGTTIISPNYPYNYPEQEQDCGVTIQFDEGKRVLIYFESFDIELTISCSYDSLTLLDGTSSDSDALGKLLCGNTKPDTINSTGQAMTLVFKNDGSLS